MLEKFSSAMPLNWLIRLTGQRLFLPFYHAVQEERALPHIRHLYRLRHKKQFEKDLDFLLKHYRPVGLEDLLEYVKGRSELPENAFFLSFDDGLREVHDIVAPILQKKSIPATVFLNSAFVDNKGLFFRYKASLLIEALEKNHYSGVVLKQVRAVLNEKAVSGKSLKARILNLDYPKKAVLDDLARILAFSFDDFLKNQQPYLVSEQIQSLKAKGFTFGAHSIDHPLFNQLDPRERIRQIQDSLRFVTQSFQLDYKVFSFPFTDFGLGASLFQTIGKEQLADLTFGCAGLKNEQFKFHLQRFPMEGSAYSARQLLTSTYIYYILKFFIGKNTIHRT